jgi:rhamnulokinase
MKRFLAIDLGAESGRTILGTLDQSRLTLEELHRFLNEPVRLPDGLYWDSFRLFHNICEGLRVAGRERKIALDGIGVDTWGVDYGLIDRHGELVVNPRHYRDARNSGMMERTFQEVPRETIFEQTGLQFMNLNSLYQIHAVKLAGSPALEAADRLLFMPDLLNYWLSGVKANELTIASTSQFYDPARQRWATELFDRLGLPSRILGEIVPPGRLLGPLLEPLRDSSGLSAVPVYTTAGHDTAAAVAAVPASSERPWCYISSGTWSLMGVELEAPLINHRVLELNFTNEVGVSGRIRLLKNIAGLWIVQECRRAWALEGRQFDYAQLTEQAAGAQPLQAVIPPDEFLDPGHMPERIVEYCRRTGQTQPAEPGQYIRIVLESLALRYRQVLESLESVVGHRIEVIHIVGGGSKNRLLNQLVAEATGRTVVAGPAEATAAGNVLVQAMGAGELSSLDQLRNVVRHSFELETFPAVAVTSAWQHAYDRFRALA